MYCLKEEEYNICGQPSVRRVSSALRWWTSACRLCCFTAESDEGYTIISTVKLQRKSSLEFFEDFFIYLTNVIFCLVSQNIGLVIANQINRF